MSTPVYRRATWFGLSKQVASSQWDGLLWGCAAVSLLGIVLTKFVPAVSQLAVLFSVTLLANGPYGAFIPAAQEAIVMVFARLYHPAVVALVATIGATAVEYVNYRLFTAAVHSQYLMYVRRSTQWHRVVGWFEIQPFATVFVSALLPIPFILARIVATGARYPIARFLTANALARFPRFWLYGALGGMIPLSTLGLTIAGLVVTVVFGFGIWWRRYSRRGDSLERALPVLD